MDKAKTDNVDFDTKATFKELSFHVGGHRLHSLFWANLAPPGKGGGEKPSKTIAKVIDREAATIHFFSKGLHRTREETGILIYLSVFEGKAWVLGDRGVNAAVPSGFWQEVVDQVVAGIKADRPAAAICAAVGRIRGVLAEKFPAASGDTNELPNLIVDV